MHSQTVKCKLAYQNVNIFSLQSCNRGCGERSREGSIYLMCGMASITIFSTTRHSKTYKFGFQNFQNLRNQQHHIDRSQCLTIQLIYSYQVKLQNSEQVIHCTKDSEQHSLCVKQIQLTKYSPAGPTHQLHEHCLRKSPLKETKYNTNRTDTKP